MSRVLDRKHLQLIWRAFKMRRRPTRHEKIMREILRNLDIEYKSQYIIYPYIVDFLIPDKKIIIEIDGRTHDTTVEYDDKRSKYLLFLGYNVYRLDNKDVHINNVKKIIYATSRS